MILYFFVVFCRIQSNEKRFFPILYMLYLF